MNRFELNKALKVKLNEFDKTINPFERNDVLFINESEYPEFLEVTTEEVTHENNKDPYKTITISDKKDRFIAKNKITRNSNSYYLSSNFNDSSSLLISHNIYSLGNKIMNEVSASVNNHLIGQTIEISYNISTGDLTSFVIENNKKVELSNEEAREKLLQILNVNYLPSMGVLELYLLIYIQITTQKNIVIIYFQHIVLCINIKKKLTTLL